MKMNLDDLEWIEQFYEYMEAAGGYTRPKDYIERAMRVLNRTYSPVSWKIEGTKGHTKEKLLKTGE